MNAVSHLRLFAVHVVLCLQLGALLTDVACYCERAGLLLNSLFLLRSQKAQRVFCNSVYVRVRSRSQQNAFAPKGLYVTVPLRYCGSSSVVEGVMLCHQV